MPSHTPSIAAQLPASIPLPSGNRRRFRPLRLERLPILRAASLLKLFGQAIVGREKIINLLRCDFAVDVNAVELALVPFERSLCRFHQA